MRILQVAPFYPPHVGGIEFHVEALSRKLVEAGHQVTVFTSNLPKAKKHEVAGGIDIYRFRSWFTPLNNPLLPGLWAGLLRHHDFDVIHAHGHFHLSTTLALLANILVRKPVVLTSHGAILELTGWRRIIEVVFNNTVGRWTLTSAGKIIALAPSQAELLQNLGAQPGKLNVIPLWIDMGESPSPSDVQKFRHTYSLVDRKVVLFVGRILPVKGLIYLIEAAKHAGTKPAIVIIGDEAPGYSGAREALLRKVEELGLQNDVFFLGRFSRDDLSVAYTAADIFVLPSLGEGMPLTLLEAMAHGKPVVTTNVPGNQDVVDHERNGLLVEPRDPLQLAQGIDRLLNDGGLRKTLGSQAQRHIERNFSHAVVVRRILDLYEQLQRVHLKP